MSTEKGATYLDKLCHKFYDEPKGHGERTGYVCRVCGGPLETYYCEERLYLVKCADCGTLALVKAANPGDSAKVTLARPALTPLPRWVSVDERLPEPDEGVLAIVSGKPADNITLHDAYELARFVPDEGWIIDEWPEWENPTVTWWMPLPEPPEGHL